MTERVYLQPAEGLIVRDPDNLYLPLPVAGGRVLLTHYWRRRLAAGDALPAEPPPAPHPSEDQPDEGPQED